MLSTKAWKIKNLQIKCGGVQRSESELGTANLS